MFKDTLRLALLATIEAVYCCVLISAGITGDDWQYWVGGLLIVVACITGGSK